MSRAPRPFLSASAAQLIISARNDSVTASSVHPMQDAETAGGWDITEPRTCIS